MDMTEQGFKCLKTAICNIRDGICTRVDLGHNTIVYKIPSPNPRKYTIRIDIKEELE